TELMCHFFLSFNAFREVTGREFREYFAAELSESGPSSLQSMQEDGLLKIRDTGIEVMPVGRFLIRNIAMCFDAYLKRPDAKKGYSRTI
ncbi:MAG TPA: coproporphyrinogen III oxidase, partial [Leptospiraceae bacterium]|nr:coproporphyrinogen III oxidase [Leptospiraceae bacterium]